MGNCAATESQYVARALFWMNANNVAVEERGRAGSRFPPNFRQRPKGPILSCGSGINRQMLHRNTHTRMGIKAISRGVHVAKSEIGREAASK